MVSVESNPKQVSRLLVNSVFLHDIYQKQPGFSSLKLNWGTFLTTTTIKANRNHSFL